jgi:protein-disulfide isomerase
MNRSVAIIVALVVIVGAGVGAYVKFGDRGPATENAAAPAETAAPPAAPPAAATAEGTAAATAASATTTESTAAATAAPAATAETPAAAASDTSSGAAASAPSAPSTDGSGSTTAPASSSPTPPAQTATSTVTPPAPVQPVITPEDHVLGSAEATVTIVEYASMTCPHCAAFHAESMPKLKSEFIDKNQVRLVFRPFPLDRLALRASLMAECAPEGEYFALLDKLFATQKDWMQAANPLDALRAIGKDAGIEESKIDGCMTDEKAIDRIGASYKDAVDVHGVNSTPSFIINGTKYAGALPFDDLTSGGSKVSGLNTIIRELLPK